jgi:hypothetical protein
MIGAGAGPLRHRPGVVLVVLGLLFLAGDLGLVAFDAATGRRPPAAGSPVVGQLATLGRLPLLPPETRAGLAAALAALALVAAVGMLRWRRWAWVAVMLAAAVLLTVNLVAAVVGTADHLAMVLAVAVVFYLNRSDVQRAFAPLAGTARA